MPKRTPKSETTEATVTNITKPKRAKQTELAGMEKPSHPELDTLIELRDEQTTTLGETRQAIGQTNEKILETCARLGVKGAYRNDTAVPPLVLTITEGSVKVKVVKAKAKAEPESEADGE